MLDENEFKPFTLNDFSVSDATSENTEGISTLSENLAISDQIESFKPLTFEEEEVSVDFISKESNGFQEVKTDAEKIQLSEDFKNSEFFLENSLLTDAEEFAETIREGAKLHKAQLIKQIEEQANDTDRIHQKTVAENQAAEQQRKKLMSETEAKVQQIKDEAYKEGFEAGRIQGMQQLYDEAGPLTQQANKILEQLGSLRKVVRFQAEEELVKLALQISKNIVAEEIKLNQDVIKNIVQVALHETEVQGKIYLYLHPDDYDFLLKSKTELERYLSEEQNLVIRQNPEMTPGSINVESDEEIISRSIEEQFNLIEENLNEQIENRQAHLNEVDIDAHNFNLTSDQGSNTAKLESANSQNLNNSDESLVQVQIEHATTPEEFVETEKTDDTVLTSDSEDAVNKENSFLENGSLKLLEESNNISQEEADAAADS
ncbi:MAG: FliH/SctL family protein, partial [bacterium]